LAGIRRSHKNIVPITTITSFVQCRIDTFCSRIKKIVSRLIKKNIPLSPPQIILKTLSWPEWDQIEDKKFVASIQGWLEKTLKNTKYEALIPIVSGLCWDTLTLTKQSSLKNVGQKLRTIAIPESQAILNAFATSIFKNGIDLCLRKWTTFSELILSLESVIQRERQLFGAAWGSEIFLLKVTDPSESLFGFSEPRELPWELPLVCWSTREIKALRDFLTGIAKSLASHGLVPFRDLRSESNQTLKLSASLPPVGIRLQAPSANTPSYDHQLTSTALNATRNLILSKFFALDLVMKSEVVKLLRTHLDLQYPRAKSIWERRLHNLSSKNIETQFVNLVDAFQPLMGLPVLYDPFRSPDLNQLSMPGPVFVIGVHNIPFECTFGIPLPSIIATGKNGALRIRIVRVSSTQECTWWGDRSVHISKISQQKTEDVLASILGDGLNFVISA